ncbi:C40 family peptidase [Christiangramia forsetii]|uniref:NlpC/P60 family protein n=2 Tax=Christiangramia forsetii TaxID=411153 RepID=A0M6M7_CHRFK|nr:C40 family peptidase [Christiangramia forsetii]GGG30007.1 cytochrome c [Christiangramia forsetii]CAL68272.1 NlpC/P60 family protein [Christiangramia forsetii KT0803]
MKMKLNYMAIVAFLVFMSCEEKAEKDTTNEADAFISQVSEEYAPDSRVALFDVEAVKKDQSYILKGESNLPAAVEGLKQKMTAQNLKFTDSIRMLPDNEGLEDKTMGVVKISVANLRDEPKHSAQLVTQATLGMPLKVYKKQGGWYYIQTPDGYLGWVDYGGIANKTKEEFSEWKSSEKLIYLKPFGSSHEKPDNNSQSVTDLVAGDILELLSEENGFFKAIYPDGREAFIAKAEAQPYQNWLSSLDMQKEDLVETSKKLMGLPYLWGGTSPKGVDCSGFTKTVYFLNGMVIPRDASQQIHTGKLVDSTKSFENLIPGDLLFFGRPATDSTSERVIHVGMWIGENRFIHSMGDVHVSTMDTTASDFDEYNYNRYLRTKRVFNETDDQLIYLKQKDIFTDANSEVVSE